MEVLRQGICRSGHKRQKINRERILKRDNYRCQYCLNPAECIDHIVPFSRCRHDQEDNLIAACNMCNSIAADRCFDTFDEKRLFIATELLRRCRMAKRVVWSTESLSELTGRLRKYVSDNAIVVASIEEARHVEHNLLKLEEHCETIISEGIHATA